MADYQFSTRKYSSSAIASVRRVSTGQNSFVAIRGELLTSVAFGATLTSLFDTIANSLTTFSHAANQYSDIGFRDWMKPENFKASGAAWRAARDVTISRNKELAETRRDWSTPRFGANDLPAHIRAELRASVATKKAIQGIEAALGNFDVAAAVAEGGEALALANGWTPDLWARFIDNFAERNLARRLEAQFSLAPSAADPLRVGADREASTKAAQAHVAGHRRSLEEVDAVRGVLTAVVDMTALMMDASRDAAFDTLLAA